MTIETKFKEGDTIFFLSNQKVISSIVRGFKIERLANGLGGHENKITYFCNSDPNERISIKVEETNAYPTKKDLLASL